MSDLLQTIQNQIAKEWFAKNDPKVSEVNWKWEYVDYKARLNDLWPEVCKRYAFELSMIKAIENRNIFEQALEQRRHVHLLQAEIERLKESNKELVEALKAITNIKPYTKIGIKRCSLIKDIIQKSEKLITQNIRSKNVSPLNEKNHEGG